MKRAALAILVLLLVIFARHAHAGSITDSVQDIITQLDIGGLQSAVDALPDELKGFNVLDYIKKLAGGEMTLDMADIISGAWQMVMRSATENMAAMSTMMALALLCTLLNRLSDAFKSNGVARACEYGCYLLAVTILITLFNKNVGRVKEAISTMIGIINSLLPTLMVLLTAVGGAAGSGFLQPVVALATGGVTRLIQDVTLRAAWVAALLAALDHINDRIRVSRLLSLFLSICNWTLGIAFTVFLGVMTVRGLAASTIDGISIRTAKYAIDNFVPVIGGLFADSVDVLVGGSLIVKSAVGTAGLLVLVLACLQPLINILMSVFSLKISAAVLQPLGENRLAECINDFAKVMMALFLAVLAVSAMMFVIITQLMTTGSATVMMR